MVRGLDLAVGDDLAFGHCFGRLHGTLMNGTATTGIWARVTLCFRKLDGSICAAAKQWPTSNPDRCAQPVRTHPGRISQPTP